MKIVIVEDEAVAARRLERMVREILKNGIDGLAVLNTLGSAEQYCATHDVDIVLLDLNLGGHDGFDLLKRFSTGAFKTIVVSANTDRAIAAFEFGVVDFVPKPVEPQRLKLAFDRVAAPITDKQEALKYLAIRNLGAVDIVAIESIAYLQGAGDYVEIHQRDGKMVLHSKSLEQLEKMLPVDYMRIHKSYIVNITDVRKVHVYGGGRYEVELADSKRFPLGRSRYRELKAKLEGRME